MEIEFVHDIIEDNGKTIKENNLAKLHNIPIGTLVEVKWDEWFGGGACIKSHARLWVVIHSRDCDGTPLYVLSKWKDPATAKRFHEMEGGFGEESLTPIEITQELKDGYGALEWGDTKEDM